jgi:hypothetical protein
MLKIEHYKRLLTESNIEGKEEQGSLASCC